MQSVEYNDKTFLAPESINSMSAIHCKIYEDGKGIIRISDCHNSIRLWNFVNTQEGAKEMLEKIYMLKRELIAFETMIKATLN
jgi:Ca2+-binding EF-hand superfamily protein